MLTRITHHFGYQNTPILRLLEAAEIRHLHIVGLVEATDDVSQRDDVGSRLGFAVSEKLQFYPGCVSFKFLCVSIAVSVRF